MDAADARDHAVGRQIGGAIVGEQAILNELGLGVEQQPDPLAAEQLAFGAVLLVVLGGAAAHDARGALAQLRDGICGLGGGFGRRGLRI